MAFTKYTKEELGGQAVNYLYTTLTSTISGSDMTIPVSDTSDFPDGSSGIDTIFIDDECILYSSKTPTTFVVSQRDYGDRLGGGQTHTINTLVRQEPEASQWNRVCENLADAVAAMDDAKYIPRDISYPFEINQNWVGYDLPAVRFLNATKVTIVGAAIAAVYPAAGDVTFSIRDTANGGGSGFNLTISSGDYVGESSMDNSLSLTSDYAYINVVSAGSLSMFTITIFYKVYL
mgnify:CR=1 FL=1